jgi:hypothetical protein
MVDIMPAFDRLFPALCARLSTNNRDRQNTVTIIVAYGGNRLGFSRHAEARWRAAPQTFTAAIVPTMFGSSMLRVSDGLSYRVNGYASRVQNLSQPRA